MDAYIENQDNPVLLNAWMPFDKNIKRRGKMLFWDKNKKDWFEGSLIDDSEYGLVISMSEYYRSLRDITHYMIIDFPA